MIFSVCLIAISLSFDALGAGLAYGIKRVAIPFSSKLIICLFSIIYSAISLEIGNILYNYLTSSISNIVGISLFIIIGLWFIIQSFKTKKDQVISEDSIESDGIINKKESIIIGLLLSIDSIGIGISSALAGFNLKIIPLIIGIFQLSFLYIGIYVGNKVSLCRKFDEKKLSVFPGIIFLLLAVIKILN